MKMFWIMIFFVTFGLGGMGYAQHYVESTVEEIVNTLETVETALAMEDKDSAQKAFDACNQQYLHMLDRMTTLVHRGDLTEVRVTLGTLGTWIQDEAWRTARATCTETKLLLTEIAEKEKIEWKNIF